MTKITDRKFPPETSAPADTRRHEHPRGDLARGRGSVGACELVTTLVRHLQSHEPDLQVPGGQMTALLLEQDGHRRPIGLSPAFCCRPRRGPVSGTGWPI